MNYIMINDEYDFQLIQVIKKQEQQKIDNRNRWKDPTPEMLESKEFNAIWDCIKSWDINIPGVYEGYMSATGNHVKMILDILNKIK